MTLNPDLEHRFDTEDCFWGLLEEDIIQLCLFIVSAVFVNKYLSLRDIVNMQKTVVDSLYDCYGTKIVHD